jgi:hypothetical protein
MDTSIETVIAQGWEAGGTRVIAVNRYGVSFMKQ